LLVLERAYLWTNAARKRRQNDGIDPVCLCQAALGARKIAHLAWIDDCHRQAMVRQFRGHAHLQTACGFHDHQRWRGFLQARHDPGKTRIVVIHMQRLSIGINVHIQRCFGHIDASELLGKNFSHFSHPILAKYGLTGPGNRSGSW
jgi:hypothetical protein